MNKPVEKQILGAVPALLQAESLRKVYGRGPSAIEVLQEVHLHAQSGESLAIVGASGSGKTTLLHVLGGLEHPSSGKVVFRGADLYQISQRERCKIRAARIGFVFQFYHLLPELDVLANVCLPARNALAVAAAPAEAAEMRARKLLEMVGLGHRLTHLPGELSGGEQQRAALARALINNPDLVLADEPTGNLDADNGAQVLTLLFDLVRREHRTLVMVTHNQAVAERCDRMLELSGGRLRAPQRQI